MTDDLKILDPVPSTPPVERDQPLRKSKWDPLLEQAKKSRNDKEPTIPVKFDKYSSATSARRRIVERAENLGDGDKVNAEQRGNVVYVTWTG